MNPTSKQVLQAINAELGSQYGSLADAIGWYASAPAQAEDFTAEFTWKQGLKKPKTLFKERQAPE